MTQENLTGDDHAVSARDTPPPYNPYGAPVAAASPRGDVRAPGEVITWLYAGAVALSFSICLVLRFQVELGFTRGELRPLAGIVDGPLIWAKMILALAWVYFSWRGVPPRSRGDVSPVNAVVRLIFPVYSLYWVFAVNTRLCDALEATLAQAGDHRPAPRLLALVAPVGHFVFACIGVVMLAGDWKSVAFVPMALANLGWIAFAFRCDILRRAVAGLAVQVASVTVSSAADT
jgi:hypothetical protein